MAVDAQEPVLDQFLGSDEFPIEWRSEREKELFWVFDDLHCPHPLSPMFYEIGGWWLTCDHMFRRFGTPFACDWITKNVNGYLYTAAVPADSAWAVDAMEYGYRYGARVPLAGDYATNIGAYLDAALPVYGEHFVDWWRGRLVPEMERNFAFLEGELARQDAMSVMELAVLLEDAIDVHDRHWKIHWMLNFAQLSATLKLRAVMEKTHGSVDEALLGRLQNSASDRNWDSIRALWEMKEEAKADGELSRAFGHDTAGEILAALEATERGRRFVAERVTPYQQEFGWHAVWSHEFVFPTVYEKMEPVIELVRGYLETDYDYPATMGALKADIEAASREILEGLEGEALEEMRAANETNLQMAPLTPDHHFYIDQGANAHVRLVLIAIGRKLVERGDLHEPDDVIFLRYNELRVLMADSTAIDARALVEQRREERERAYAFRPPAWIGTATQSQLDFPYLTNWGFPEKFHRKPGEAADRVAGIGGSPGVVEGVARVVLREDQFDEVRAGDILVCHMTNPAWVVLFTKIAGLVTNAGGLTAHPAVLSREFGIPAVVGTQDATQRIRTGDRVRVDGGTGVVEILEAAAQPKNDLFTA
ncbi:MAG TPA: PEP-utilizing enzyme [Candidatus Limnocylindria bacterium]|jgi:pyruvate,water dikinase|nr:PEP-utilizing enzyme [Candidatus Limnocylindria bacterium]